MPHKTSLSILKIGKRSPFRPVLGWNFGDGHLHSEQLLRAVQKRCSFDSAELRCIFVESQPLGIPYMNWRIWDAKDGKLAEGQIAIDNLIDLQPWPETEILSNSAQ